MTQQSETLAKFCNWSKIAAARAKIQGAVLKQKFLKLAFEKAICKMKLSAQNM